MVVGDVGVMEGAGDFETRVVAVGGQGMLVGPPLL